MIYGYARVSTEAQDLTSQLAQLKGAGCAKVFREKLTGTNTDRPQLRRLMAALADGDLVVIPAVDRLSRDTTDLLLIAREMQKADHSLTLSSIRLRTLPRSFLRSSALPPSWNAATSWSARHEAAPTRRRRASNLGASPHSPRVSSARRGSGLPRERRNAASPAASMSVRRQFRD